MKFFTLLIKRFVQVTSIYCHFHIEIFSILAPTEQYLVTMLSPELKPPPKNNLFNIKNSETHLKRTELPLQWVQEAIFVFEDPVDYVECVNRVLSMLVV